MIRYQKDTDHIVTLTLDMKHRSVNIINHEVGASLTPVIEYLRGEKAKRKLKGVIITSGKNNFMVGGDLDYLSETTDPNMIFQFSQTMQAFYRELEQPGVPVVAAINGTALGSGFELALACHHRIVVDDASIRLGHPEVTLGVMPGAGGVIRLLWMLGLEKAFGVLAEGKRYAPKEALEIGIVDALAKDRTDMLLQAKQWLLAHPEEPRTWDSKEGRIPKGTTKNLSLALVVQKLTAKLVKESYGNYSAPMAILQTLSEGSKVDFDTACRIESRNFTKLVNSPAARNMIHALWYDFKKIKEGKSRPKGFGKFRPRKVGIIGAGKIGTGVAMACLMRGMSVVLKDVSTAIAEQGRVRIVTGLKELVADGRWTPASFEKQIANIKTTDKAADFKDCDLVIEAVFENANLKTKVNREAEQVLDVFSFLASNTISIPISKLAESYQKPENFVGLHFFPPAEKVPLVEIVKGKQTSEETLARAYDFVQAIRKIPIIVKDNWGFFVARVQNTFILEGITLLQEGYNPALIEQLSVQAGMPTGPLQLADHLSLSIVYKYEKQAADHYGAKYIAHPATTVLQKMIDDLDRKGTSNGFYENEENQTTALWSELTNHFPTTKTQVDREEITERLLFVQVIEAVWCLQERVIKTTAAANLGSIHGWGFPAFKGGVVQFISDYGLKAFAERCNHYENIHGPRFQLPGLLKDMLKKEVEVFSL
ncbi:MAG: 3-hydroxyacyl-CoA dehydrogenase NAD-binding domain-containing protein [Saprospiraceae bacterium]